MRKSILLLFVMFMLLCPMAMGNGKHIAISDITWQVDEQKNLHIKGVLTNHCLLPLKAVGLRIYLLDDKGHVIHSLRGDVLDVPVGGEAPFEFIEFNFPSTKEVKVKITEVFHEEASQCPMAQKGVCPHHKPPEAQ